MQDKCKWTICLELQHWICSASSNTQSLTHRHSELTNMPPCCTCQIYKCDSWNYENHLQRDRNILRGCESCIKLKQQNISIREIVNFQLAKGSNTVTAIIKAPLTETILRLKDHSAQEQTHQSNPTARQPTITLPNLMLTLLIRQLDKPETNLECKHQPNQQPNNQTFHYVALQQLLNSSNTWFTL